PAGAAPHAGPAGARRGAQPAGPGAAVRVQRRAAHRGGRFYLRRAGAALLPGRQYAARAGRRPYRRGVVPAA
nr:hypothetical protein [Tanacetum cinerariifolium]